MSDVDPRDYASFLFVASPPLQFYSSEKAGLRYKYSAKAVHTLQYVPHVLPPLKIETSDTKIVTFISLELCVIPTGFLPLLAPFLHDSLLTLSDRPHVYLFDSPAQVGKLSQTQVLPMFGS